MRKIILTFVVVGLMASCGVTKTERQAQKSLKGDWSLTNITYPGSSGFVDVTLFNDATTRCFRDSDWHFISNNHKGSYQLYKENCAPGKRFFRWDIVLASDGQYYFSLKPVQQDENARKVETGYRLNVVQLDATQMILEETVSYNGNPFKIRLTFNKY